MTNLARTAMALSMTVAATLASAQSRPPTFQEVVTIDVYPFTQFHLRTDARFFVAAGKRRFDEVDAMDVLIHAKLHKPERMSDQEFFGVWKEEAKAALGAVEAGIIKNIWKVPGEYRVIVVMGVESVDQIDEVMHSLPISKLGYDYIIDMEWTLLRPYEHWAKQLHSLAAG